MKWLKKGEWGYYKRKRTYQLAMVLLCTVAIFVFWLSGYLVTKTSKNVMTVLAVLFSLPLANFAVVWFALLSQRPLDKEQYETWKKLVTQGIFMTELAITSPNSATIPAVGAYVYDMQVVLYCNGKVDLDKAKQYVTNLLAESGYGGVTVDVTDDTEIFSAKLQELEVHPMEQKGTAGGLANLLKCISI